MLKILAILGLFIAVAGTIVLVTCKYQSSCQKETFQADHAATDSLVAPNLSPIPAKAQQDAKQRPICASCWHILLAWPTGITAWAVILTLFAISWQSAETRKAAESAMKSITLQEKQLRHVESQTRPWIGLDIDTGFPANSLSIDGGGNVSTSVVITARNFGYYPGQNVFAGVDLVLTNTLDDVRGAEEKIWASIIPEKAGSVLFPGPSRVRWQWSASVQKTELARFLSETELLAFIVGCIWYRDQFGKRHYTVFSYQLKKPGSIFSVAFKALPNIVVSGQWVESHGFVDPPEERATNEPANRQNPN
jgi:hypothetical protein